MVDNITLTASDRDHLRGLAERLAHNAQNPIHEEHKREWIRHNALEPGRPLIWASPEGAWGEIITGDDLLCEGALARDWEYRLRMELTWSEFLQDDKVIEPHFNVGAVVSDDGWGVHVETHHGDNRGSYVWDAPIADYARDLPKIHTPNRTYHKEATLTRLALAHDTFDGILQVRFKPEWGWFIPVTGTVINLRGLQNLMLDMYDEPDGLKQLLALVQRAGHELLDWAESNELLSLNNDGAGIASGGFGWSKELPSAGYSGVARPIDMWGFAESQETVGVSAKLFEEFILPLQIGWCERFGLNCYGCCEPVDKRWEGVKRIPRLRRISVSPWSDTEKMAENLGPNYVFSWKPSPSDLAMEGFHEDAIRNLVRTTLTVCKEHDCRLEMIMKDTHTVRNEPTRIQRWVRICREEIDHVYGG